MLLTLQLYFDSFLYKNRHNSNPNIDFNFGTTAVTFMRGERGISFGAAPLKKQPHHPTQTTQGLKLNIS